MKLPSILTAEQLQAVIDHIEINALAVEVDEACEDDEAALSAFCSELAVSIYADWFPWLVSCTCGHDRDDHGAGGACLHMTGSLIDGVTLCGCRAFEAQS